MTTRQGKDLCGLVLHDTYRLVRKLAQGGMGELYEAEHARLAGKRYAVKLLLPEAAGLPEMVARFRREAEITSELGHANIVEMLDFHETDEGRPFLVMEYLEGEDLGALLQQRGRLSPAEVAALARQVGDALAAAHARGVVHRDMKPENIYMLPPGEDGLRQAKVLDFGISKIRHSRSVVTREHSVLGTPYYMSPEQAVGEVGDIDHATDIFALGTIFYLCLTGRLPFDAPTMPGVIYKICHTDPTPVTEVMDGLSAEVDVVIGRALAKTKADRYPSMEAFVKAMAAALELASGSRLAPVTARGLGPAHAPATAAGVPGHAPATAAEIRQATTLSRSAGEQLPTPAGRTRGVKVAVVTVAALVLAFSAWAMFSMGGGGEGRGAAPEQAKVAAAPAPMVADMRLADSTVQVRPDQGVADRAVKNRPRRRPKAARRKKARTPKSQARKTTRDVPKRFEEL